MTSLDRLDNRSLSARVRENLLDHIRSGAFPEGRLPSETELGEQLGVSRTSVRAALQSLERDAIVTRRRGLGTFINDHIVRSRIPLNRLVGFAAVLEDAGQTPEVVVEELREGPLDAETAQALSLESGIDAVTVRKLFRADGKPAIDITDVFLREQVVRPVRMEDVPSSTFEFAERFCATPVGHAVVELIPRLPSAATRERLALDLDEPVMRLVETHYSPTNQVVGYSVIDARDRIVRFRMVRTNQ